jgi:trk system potassium uptake protein TrkH
MFWRPIFLVNGIMITVIGIAMFLPMIADLITRNDNWQIFAISGMISIFVGMSLFLTNRGYSNHLKIRQAFLLTTTSYISVVTAAAIPLYLADYDLSWAGAFFEIMSGITTTGSTVLVGLDNMPKGILLWRALMNGLGGIGVVVLAIAILPMLSVGGMQLFKTESSDNSDKLLPRAPQIALTITFISLVLTLLCAWCYWIFGMGAFDAICHAMSTIATGGFANYDASIGHFKSWQIEFIAIFFMICGSLPLLLFYNLADGNWRSFFKNSQVRVFIGLVIGASSLIAFWLVVKQNMAIIEALRHSLFAVTTILSTTGFVTADYMQWGSFPIHFIFLLTVVGGCTGSTAGGIKIFRFQVFYEVVKAQMQRLLQPNGVFLPRYNGKIISNDVIFSVMNFLLVFASCFIICSLLLSIFDLDFITSMSAVAQALANVGPGLGGIIGPAGNFSTLPDGAIWVLSFCMLLGRLELFTVLLLFTPAFWRK